LWGSLAEGEAHYSMERVYTNSNRLFKLKFKLAGGERAHLEETVGKQIGEANEGLPARGCAG